MSCVEAWTCLKCLSAIETEDTGYEETGIEEIGSEDCLPEVAELLVETGKSLREAENTAETEETGIGGTGAEDCLVEVAGHPVETKDPLQEAENNTETGTEEAEVEDYLKEIEAEGCLHEAEDFLGEATLHAVGD